MVSRLSASTLLSSSNGDVDSVFFFFPFDCRAGLGSNSTHSFFAQERD